MIYPDEPGSDLGESGPATGRVTTPVSVDVFITECGEPLAVVDRALRSVAALEWDGPLDIYVLNAEASVSRDLGPVGVSIRRFYTGQEGVHDHYRASLGARWLPGGR